ncbi:MAG: hypothetical protein EOP22_04270 [Hyphomicrobiales bacterium]|nr:MAG: hypothetical protein EOP22_04270 [Hyphomicrobiales bacterium]
MIVDAHIHLFRRGYTGFAGTSPLGGQSDVAFYEQLMQRHGIGQALVVCYEEDIDPGNNAYVRELAITRPWIASVAYLPCGHIPSVEALLDLLAAGHVGVSLYLADDEAARGVAAWPREVWETLDHARALISINAPPPAVSGLRALIERTPGCQFMFAHLGLPGRVEAAVSAPAAEDRLASLLALAPLANVSVKLSGLYAVDPTPPHVAARPFVDALRAHFSADRLHWGSDFSPVLEFAGFEHALEQSVLADCSGAERRLIMGEGLAARLRAIHKSGSTSPMPA